MNRINMHWFDYSGALLGSQNKYCLHCIIMQNAVATINLMRSEDREDGK